MTKDEALVKRMLEWVDSLKRQSDYGQHINIPSGLSARTCWELANELEQFLKALEAKVEPVAWDGYNLDDMCEAFNRVIEEHCHKKHPFHDPVNNDAMIALRTLRGFIPYMKRHTTPPQRKPLTDEHIQNIWHDQTGLNYFAHVAEFVRAIEAAHGIKGEA